MNDDEVRRIARERVLQRIHQDMTAGDLEINATLANIAGDWAVFGARLVRPKPKRPPRWISETTKWWRFAIYNMRVSPIPPVKVRDHLECPFCCSQAVETCGQMLAEHCLDCGRIFPWNVRAAFER